MLVTVSTAGAPASLRVHVWRRLRGLGGLYLQQSVCLLPDLPPVSRLVLRLMDRVRRDGGTGRVLHVQLPDRSELEEVVAGFQAARDEEYREVLERLPEFFTELEQETARGRATYAEVEENEADLARYRDWMGKIAARDYFNAPGGEAARAELTRAEQVFAAFEAAALAAEEPAVSQSAAPPAASSGSASGSGEAASGRLRAVREQP